MRIRSSNEVELPAPGESSRAPEGAKDSDVLSLVRALFEHARASQAPLAAKWRRYDAFYRGKQWERSLEKWRAQIVVNICFPTIENQLAVMADSSMRMAMAPVEGGDAETASALDFLLHYGSAKNEWSLEFILAQKTSLKYGSAILKVGWDGDRGLEGDVSVTRISPKCFFVEPGAKSIEDARYVFEAKLLTLSEIKRLHPKTGKNVKPGAGLPEELGFSVGERSDYNRGHLTGQEEASLGEGGISDLLARALYVECWLRDYSTETVVEEREVAEEVEGEDGKKRVRRRKVKEKHEIPRYPGGRHIVFAGDTLLLDEPNPFWHRRFPYVKVDNYPDEEGFWGMSEIENLISLQQEINKRRSQVADHATATGNAPWVVTSQSGIKADDISNKPNLVIKTKDNSGADFGVRRLPPSPLPDYIASGHLVSIRDAEYVSGVHEILQGQQPGSVRDFSALRTVQEIAERRVRTKMEFHQAALRQMGRMAAALFMQYYDSDRWKRILSRAWHERLIEARLSTDPPLNVDEHDKPVRDRLSFQLDEVYELYDYLPQSEAMTRNTRELYRQQLKDLRQIVGPTPQGPLDELLLRSYGLAEIEAFLAEIKEKEPEEEKDSVGPPVLEGGTPEELMEIMAANPEGAAEEGIYR